MKLLVMKFRVNDLDSSYGKQIEFNSGIVNDFFSFTSDTEYVEFIYKGIIQDSLNDGTIINAILVKSPARGDYKIYTNEDGSVFLKQFFLEKLGLTLDNINDFFAIKKIGSKKYEISYIPVDSEVGKFFSSQNLAGQIIDIENESQLNEKISKPYNRIVFGAPGTGKSNKLSRDCEYYFNKGDKKSIKERIYSEIHSQPSNIDQDEWITSIGFKYSKYFFENYIDRNQQNALIDDFKLLDSGKTTTKKKEQIVAGAKTARLLKMDGNTYSLNSMAYERVTFHPNYSYAQFVGTYKPVQDEADEKQIKYEYVPGAFMRIYVSAKNNPSQNFLLLIEEINRANVAAVFGDVFQLLDRKADGTSEYPVTVSEDIKKYLTKNGIQEDVLSIPSNMYIWATMNSADQGVFPMDTAFKRRWEFEYIGIDENEKEVESFYIPINNNKKVKWNELRRAINDKLIELGINEDKLLGPFFMNKTVLENAMNKDINFIKSFESKVLMYLFEDAAKMKVRQLFNLQDNKYIYSEICRKFEKEGLAVFNFTETSKINIEDIEVDSQPVNGELF